jgi:hypothetical protein
MFSTKSTHDYPKETKKEWRGISLSFLGKQFSNAPFSFPISLFGGGG